MNISLAKKLTLLITLPALLSCQGDDRRSRSQGDSAGAVPGISDRDTQQTNQDESSQQSNTSGANDLPGSLPGDSANTGGTDTSDSQEEEDCGEKVFPAESLPPNVMLVLDKSGSMYFQSWIDGGVSKRRWASLYSVTESLLRRLDGRFNFGLKLFPALGAQESSDKTIACRLEAGVEVECGPGHADKILNTMPGPDAEVYGDTPTVSGLSAAYEYLATLNTPNPKAIVLIVDGEINCSETNEALANLAEQASNAHIPVYVVGIDLQAGVASALSHVAIRGGTKKLYNTQDSDVLVSTLENILGSVVSCTIPLKTSPRYPDKVKLRTSDNNSVPRIEGATSCAQAAAVGQREGWVFSGLGPSPKEILLCGDTCDAYRKNPKQLKVEFHCPPPV